ncbi:MAG: thermonuclease family protein [Nocardioides sp.]
MSALHMASRLTAILLVASTLSLIGGAFTPAHAADKDCGDFSTQKAAQIFFLNAGGPSRDPHLLDADGDGVSCESNPCPCYYGTKLPDDGGDSQAAPTPPKAIQQVAKVVKVVDGDTIDVRIKKGSAWSRAKRIRIIGIDTPEVTGTLQCWGPQATNAAKRIVPIGTVVTIKSDPSQDKVDKYNRLLRYVNRKSDGLDFGLAQIRQGNARVFVYANNPFNRVETYRTSLKKAKSANKGMWKAC